MYSNVFQQNPPVLVRNLNQLLLFLIQVENQCLIMVCHCSVWISKLYIDAYCSKSICKKKSMIFPNKGNCTVSFWSSNAMLKCHQSRLLVVMKQFQLLGRQSHLVDFSISLLTPPHMIFNAFQAFFEGQSTFHSSGAQLKSGSHSTPTTSLSLVEYLYSSSSFT